MPDTNTFICASCRTEHHQQSTLRPADWGLCEYGIGILCADCTSMAAQQHATAHFGWSDLAPPHPRTFTRSPVAPAKAGAFTSTAHINRAGTPPFVSSEVETPATSQPEISICAARRHGEWNLGLLIGHDQVHTISVPKWLALIAEGNRMLELMNRNWSEPVTASEEEIQTLRRAVANFTSTGAPSPVAPAQAGAATAQTDFASCKCGCVETPTQQEAA